jgi:hypothetical protein
MEVNRLLAHGTLCEKWTKSPLSQKLYELNTPHDQDTHGQLRAVEVKQPKLASSRPDLICANRPLPSHFVTLIPGTYPIAFGAALYYNVYAGAQPLKVGIWSYRFPNGERRDVAACVILVFRQEGRRLRACAHTIEVL